MCDPIFFRCATDASSSVFVRNKDCNCNFGDHSRLIVNVFRTSHYFLSAIMYRVTFSWTRG